MTSYCVEHQYQLDMQARTTITTNTHVLSVRLGRADATVVPYIQQTNEGNMINAELSSPLIVMHLDSNIIAHEGELTIASTHATGNNTYKRTRC